jgi:hypothetical protein
MTKKRIVTKFTAQGLCVSTLMAMYSLIERGKWDVNNYLPFVVFSAFAIEGYINSIGFRKVNFWDSVEKNNWREKINILHSVAGKNADWGQGPLQNIVKLFKLRDRLAHGKIELVNGRWTEDNDSVKRGIRKGPVNPDWLNKIDKEYILNLKNHFTEIMLYLTSVFNLPVNEHLLLSEMVIETEDL